MTDCVCGHTENEHEPFGLLRACLAEWCDCAVFELDEEARDADDL